MSEAAPETAKRNRMRMWSFGAYVVGLARAGNGRLMAAALADGTVRLIDSEAPEPQTVTAHAGACLSLAADCDRDAFLSGGDDGKVVRIDASGVPEVLVESKGKWIDHVASHGGSGFRVFSAGKDAFVMDRKRRDEPRRLSHATTVGGLAINPKGRRLAVAHYNGVSLWWLGAAESQAQVLSWKGSHLRAQWSPDGDYVFTSMQENALHGWRLSDGQHMRMQGYAAKVRAMDFTRKGQFLATSGADTVICWPFTGGGPMGKAPSEFGGGIAGVGMGSLVSAVACNPKIDAIAASFANGAVILGSPGGRVMPIAPPRREHEVTALAWNAAGEVLLVGDEAGDVLLIDFRGEQ